MKLDRIRNAKRNMVFGFLNKFVAIILPFILRTVVINTLGNEYLGLNSLFSSILSVLSLSELGFSSAVVYNMYKPVADGDIVTICALLKFYKRVYRIIGCIILIIGIILLPFLPMLIKGSYPSDINIYILYLIYLINTALSYFLFAYLSSILVAYQREDIISITNVFITLSLNIAQIIILVFMRNYYIYSLLLPLFTIINNIRIAYVVHKMFPQYKSEGNLSEKIIKDIKVRVSGSFIGKACGVSRNVFDSIYISAFLGLVSTAMYDNYFCIINAVSTFVSIILTSVVGGVGNSVATEEVEKNYQDMNKMNFTYMWISGWCSVCLLCLFQPFMEIWMGKAMMFPIPVVILFCLYFYSLKMGDIRTLYVQANGLWWEHRHRAIVEVVSNIILNYVLGKYFGVYGIISATLITILLINFGYGSRIIFQYYFKDQNVAEYYKHHLLYMIVTICVCCITYFMCSLVVGNKWVILLVRGGICCIVPNILYFIFYRKMAIFKVSVIWLKRVVKKN